jgi:hypothetical protein
MRSKPYFRAPPDEGEAIALFGDAKLVKFLNGTYELRGGIRARQARSEGMNPKVRS